MTYAVAGLKAGPKAPGTTAPLGLTMLPAKRDWRRVEAFMAEFLSVPEGTNGPGNSHELR